MAKLAVNYENIRSRVLGYFVSAQGKKGAICLRHPRCADEMQKAWPGIKVLRIMEGGDLAPTGKQWTLEEIAYVFDDFVDITPGSLPVATMLKIADELRETLGDLDTETLYEVDCDSGEEIVALQLAYPKVRFVARFDEAQMSQTHLSKFILDEFSMQLAGSLK
jgi:hypothetical protein